METQSYSGAATQAHQHGHHRRHHDVGEGDRWRGKSAQSVGHRAKALRAETCGHGGGCRTQGDAASSIARGIPSGQAMMQAVYVNVSYTMVALSLTGAAATTVTEDVPVAEAPVPPDPVETEGMADAAPVEAAVETAEPDEEDSGAPASGHQVSAFYYQAQLSYMSASVALELLR